MKLNEWLKKTKISVTAFAKLVGVHRCYIHTMMSGRDIPSEKVMKRISELTLENVKHYVDIITEFPHY